MTTPLSTLDRWIRKAEDELTEYSTPARKREKLRRAIGLAVPLAAQQEMRAVMDAEMSRNGHGLMRWIEEQRQTIALPCWGIAGLGLLEGFMGQPLGWPVAILGTVAAFGIQKWGWQLQARRLLWETLVEIAERTQS